MNDTDIEAMVARLEAHSAAHPWRYRIHVAALVLLGFVIVLAVAGGAGLLLLLVLATVLALLWSGSPAVWLLVAKLGKLLLLLIWPLWSVLKQSMQSLFTRFDPPQGLVVGRAQAPVLFEQLDRLRRELKGPPVHEVQVFDEVQAAVVQHPRLGLVGWPRNYLRLGLPLLEALSPDEALAVVAHEYGHLRGAHGRFGAFVYRLRLSWSALLDQTARAEGRLGRWSSAWLRRFVPHFNAYTQVLARAEEYAADQTSVRWVGAAAAANALKRVNLAAAAWSQWHDELFRGVRDQPSPPTDRAQRWAALCRHSDPRAGNWWVQAADRPAEVMDTHPTPRRRLLAMGLGADAVEATPPPLAGPSAAEAWFGPGVASLREQLQQRWHESIAEDWTERHSEHRQWLARVAELQALPERDHAAELELLNLRLRTEPEADLRAPLQARVDAEPDNALAHYLLGLAQLRADDVQGLQSLERVIALDPPSTKPACERAWEWLRSRDRDAAAHWQQRWHERHALEQARDRQLEKVSPTDRLAPPALDDAARHEVLRLLATQQAVRRAWVVRRLIDADPTVVVHLVVLELGWWARLRRQHADIVSALARQPWPMGCHLLTAHTRRRPKAEKVDGAWCAVNPRTASA
ncbi:M48 family metallopeptidase [Ideonella sp. 4Y16]|uniref:M48 family metallopeptidase n=1 Tax=Ideonella alba TaxID=2824118 RepID=UPI001B362FD8|nr:M48 family metallopeptidase [Ideonella alba]MBQ0943878.1 M48 family metallopeptidase [Ideonella alba]